jgi:UDP-glucose 4-epimerase
MHFLVTGAAGFVGSNLTDRLLSMGHTVTGYDNFSTGQTRFLDQARSHQRFTIVRGDILDIDLLATSMSSADFIFHLAANADVRFGTEHPRRDLEQNTIGTWNVLEAMRRAGVRRIAFSSTGSVYGEPVVFPTPEDAPFPVQTSLYAASKLAGEGLLQAYCEGFAMEGYIFRFVSLLGERYSHGHVIDFYRQLEQHPEFLQVLGDGTQRKSYLNVQDCIDAMLTVIEQRTSRVNIFNLGTEEYCTVGESIQCICDTLGVRPELRYTGGSRGWIGDSPFIFLDTQRIRSTGWRPKLTIRESVVHTVRYFQKNQWILNGRETSPV